MKLIRKYLPESFVRREYLPVGAPDTTFIYNYLEKNQALQIDLISEIIENYNIYFNLYDRSSLPLKWCQIHNTKYELPAPQSNGYYLLRIRPKPNYENNSTLEWQIEDENTDRQQLTIKY